MNKHERYESRHVQLRLRLDLEDAYDREIIEMLDIVRGDVTRGAWVRIWGKMAIARALGILTSPPPAGVRPDEIEPEGAD